MNKYSKSREYISVNYTMFYITACDSVNRLQENNRFFEKNDITLIDEPALRSIIYEAERLSITSIVFCAMTLESFINHYGSEKIVKPYFDECLVKLDLKSKWIKIPELATGKQINKGGKAFLMFTKLIEIRNKLVHDKNKKYISNKYNYLGDSDAFESIECVKLMITELKKIDNSIYTDWIL